jgi:hypothetical protein
MHACAVHVVLVRRRLRLAWLGTRRVARRADGVAFDRGGWPPEQPCTASLAAQAVNHNLAHRIPPA